MRKFGTLLACALLALTLSLSSCGIESFEPVIGLTPPLGLTLSNISNMIRVQFWGFNNETYFEGYTIFMAVNQSDLVNNIGYPVPPYSGETNQPTLPNQIPVVLATRYSFDVSHYTNLTALIHDQYYFFYVKSYSAVYNIYSRPSEIAEIQYKTN